MWWATEGVAQWYTYRPGLSALNVKVLVCPGATWVCSPPPKPPVTACRSMEWTVLLSLRLVSDSSTVSPSFTRSIGPGTLLPKVQ